MQLTSNLGCVHVLVKLDQQPVVFAEGRLDGLVQWKMTKKMWGWVLSIRIHLFILYIII